MDTPAVRPCMGMSCLFSILIAAPTLWAASDSLESVQKAASEWVKLRAESARIESEWATEKELLESTLVALKDRAGRLEEKRDLLAASTLKNRTETQALETKNREAALALDAVEERLKEIAAQLIELRPKLPPRLSAALELAFRSLASPLPPSERMQITMSILSRCDQFNRSVSSSEETLVTEDGGTAKSLEVIYWGCSHAYALDRKARKVWLGSPGPKAWQWEILPGSVDEVARLMAIHAGKADPEFVNVPARLAHPVK